MRAGELSEPFGLCVPFPPLSQVFFLNWVFVAEVRNWVRIGALLNDRALGCPVLVKQDDL